MDPWMSLDAISIFIALPSSGTPSYCFIAGKQNGILKDGWEVEDNFYSIPRNSDGIHLQSLEKFQAQISVQVHH